MNAPTRLRSLKRAYAPTQYAPTRLRARLRAYAPTRRRNKRADAMTRLRNAYAPERAYAMNAPTQ